VNDSTASTDLRLPRAPGTDEQARGSRRSRRRSYLPSAQVVEELSSVKDLTALADELRDCLTDSSDLRSWR